MNMARVIEVIETTLTMRGAGKPPDPVRCIIQYWDRSGNLLAEVDPSRDAKDLFKENQKLINLLVEIAHHEGALEEQRENWQPIVEKALQDRLESR